MCWLLMRSVARSSHQADVVDVRHLRTPHALIDPAHDVAQDPLRVVVQLLLHRRPGAQFGRCATGTVSKAASVPRGCPASSACRAATSTSW